jgi:hypothetical protein
MTYGPRINSVYILGACNGKMKNKLRDHLFTTVLNKHKILTKIRNKKCAIASHQKLQNKEEMKNLNK